MTKIHEAIISLVVLMVTVVFVISYVIYRLLRWDILGEFREEETHGNTTER